jgi:DNA-binding NtrC family response regulator
MATVLIVDDEPLVLQSLGRGFEAAGHTVVKAATGTDALTIGGRRQIDAAIVDVRLEDVNGLRVARELRLLHPDLVCIAITGFGLIREAVRAIRTVLDDYLEKPVDVPALVTGVERLLVERGSRSAPGVNSAIVWHGIVGASPEVQRVCQQAERMASTLAPVLITGETGTGKELMARAIHALSSRQAGPFVPVNCTSVPETLFEDAFFGHVRGSFTGAEREHRGYFEEADGGTLFLDEIGDLPAGVQTKLLRALEEQVIRPVGGVPVRVDVRILAATNANLIAMVDEGRFRADLFHRLNELAIALPPLRGRGDDIELLIDHFLAGARRDTGTRGKELSASARSRLRAHPWPGNVRELRATIRRAVLMSDGNLIDVADLPAAFHEPAAVESSMAVATLLEPDVARPTLAEAVRDSRTRIEREFLLRAIAHGLSRDAAAEALGIDRRTLLTLIDRHHIPWPRRGRDSS